MLSENTDKQFSPSYTNMPGADAGGQPLQADTDYAKKNLIQIPSINFPKGGGALKSIDEKFQANPANGSASLAIPVPLSGSRTGFMPALSLEYDSGNGNSAFGLGWDISLPSIRRRTDKFLPQYFDAEDSDIFQYTGVEDLVPTLVNDQGKWNPSIISYSGYTIRQYRPRIEAAFTKIEKITGLDGMVYWKTTTDDNTVIFFGLTAKSRIADPANPARIFKWLPELSYDDKGNCIQYEYVSENRINIPNTLHEKNRFLTPQPFANTYLKGIKYGNTKPYANTNPFVPDKPASPGYMFQLVVDYGDIDTLNPSPSSNGNWSCRFDPFSDYRAGFEIRTYRLCKRFLLFHNFFELSAGLPADPDSPFADLNAIPCLVCSLDLRYQYFNNPSPVLPDPPYRRPDPPYAEADFIASVSKVCYSGTPAAGYISKSLPGIDFFYNQLAWNNEVRSVSTDNIVNAPSGLGNNYQFTDLWGEGIPGILAEQNEGWYYKSNLGGGNFTPAQQVAPKPSFTGLSAGTLQLQDLAGDGRKFMVSTRPPMTGYFELTDRGQWLPYKPFDYYPKTDIRDPDTKFIDLNGDGMPDLIVSEEQVFTWYAAAGTAGYDSSETAYKPFDEEEGPAIVFSDPVQCIFLADMCGDGLTDIVRIRNGEICYWPNKGFGNFGAKVNMSNAPLFDLPDAFNPSYLYLGDVSGTGATDLLYLGQDRFRAWINLSGNAWSDAWEIDPFPGTEMQNRISVADLLGDGTACIIWSSPLPQNADTPMRYIDLMGGNKPYLLNGYNNNMGKRLDIEYKSSSFFYLQDKLGGEPWTTKLPFPVQCLSKTTVSDLVTGARFTNQYSYHHGYYDHPEREFRGFGRVDQTDTEAFDSSDADPLDQEPVLTRSWFHTGAYFGLDRILNQYAREYFKNPVFAEYQLPEPVLPAGLTATEIREAFRACKGMMLRQEVYALDNEPLISQFPYTVATQNCRIRQLQPLDGNSYSVFLTTGSESISYQYERNPADPRIAHTLNTVVDEYGNILESADVVYPRQNANPPAAVTGKQPVPAAVISEQQKMHLLYAVNAYTNDILTDQDYRLRTICESVSYELTGSEPAAGCFQLAEIEAAFRRSEYISYETVPDGSPQIRRLKHKRILFQSNDLHTPLSLGILDSLGMVYQSYNLAFTQSVIDAVYAGKTTTASFSEGKYISSDDPSIVTDHLFPLPAREPGEWWVVSGTIGYLPKIHFYQPYEYTDAFDNTTMVTYDPYYLLIESTQDTVGNITTVLEFNYRILAPQMAQDLNNNITEWSYDILGLVAGTALEGKNDGTEGDDLAGFVADLTATAISDFFQDPVTFGPALLQHATSRFVYDFSSLPVRTGNIARENHLHQPEDRRINPAPGAMQYSFEFTDGFGQVIMKKEQAEPGLANHFESDNSVIQVDTSPNLRWIGNGRTIFNNKGNPVKQYEPYFSDNPGFEDEPALVEHGVSPLLYYDPLGRLIQTDFPNGTLFKTSFDAWSQASYDQNDLVLDPACQWYLERTGTGTLAGEKWEADAASKAALHSNTPSVSYLDSLGRTFYSVADNKYKDRISGLVTEAFYATITTLDIEGNVLEVMDAMGNTVIQSKYNLMGQSLFQNGMDTGERWLLNDCMGKVLYAWTTNGGIDYLFFHQYDALHRPVKSYVNGNLYEQSFFGDDPFVVPGGGQPNNLRGKIYLQYDGAGLLTQAQYDFKGNLVQSSRRFTNIYAPSPISSAMPAVTWTGAPDTDNLSLQAVEYVALTLYDALNRPILLINPFKETAPVGPIILPYAGKTGTADIIVPGYSQAALLSSVDVYLRGASVLKNFVRNITHNEKGQRVNIVYGNGVSSNYDYDPLSFRLTRIHTVSGSGSVSLQDLNYYYDPIANITHILDNAQQTIFFNNKKIDPSADYTYDAIYQLIGALGREHISINNPPDNDDRFRSGLPQPGDMTQMQNYSQYYDYDAAGNLLQMGNTGRWSRACTYAVSAAPPGNRLLNSTPGDADGGAFDYNYDNHGSLLAMAHLHQMDWDFKDQLQHLDLGGGGEVFYQYDALGQRARKVWIKNQNLVCERFYMGGFEIYSETDSLGNISLQRETLHVMDDWRRIALVETKIIDSKKTDPALLNNAYSRYQFSNQIGTACLELDDAADIISYEEYYPFGSTSYQALNTDINATAKRYRYGGRERDEESGLYYIGARYYASWLGRWTAADPIGTGDGLNLYRYANNNPVSNTDANGMQTVQPDWQQVETEDPDADYYVEQNTGLQGRETDEFKEVWVPDGGNQDIVFAPDKLDLKPTPPPPPPPPPPKKPEPPIVPFDPMADSPVAKFLLYQKDSPILDYLTNDQHLKTAQDFFAGVAIAAGSIATGGLVAEAAAGAGFGATAAGAISGAGAGTFSLGARSSYEGKEITWQQAAIEIGGGALLGGLGGYLSGLKGASSELSTLGKARLNPPYTVGPTGSAIGTTSAIGDITVAPGLSGKALQETIQHEGVHRLLSPLYGPMWLRQARGAFSMAAYNKSQLLRGSEEFMAEFYATGRLRDSVKLLGKYGVSAKGYALELGAYVSVTAGGYYAAYNQYKKLQKEKGP
jgi:RHS repeat-associated protein